MVVGGAPWQAAWPGGSAQPGEEEVAQEGREEGPEPGEQVAGGRAGPPGWDSARLSGGINATP